MTLEIGKTTDLGEEREVHERLPSQEGVHFVNKLYKKCRYAQRI